MKFLSHILFLLSAKEHAEASVRGLRRRKLQLQLTAFGGEPDASRFPLQLCQGDCDGDDDVSDSFDDKKTMKLVSCLPLVVHHSVSSCLVLWVVRRRFSLLSTRRTCTWRNVARGARLYWRQRLHCSNRLLHCTR